MEETKISSSLKNIKTLNKINFLEMLTILKIFN